MKEKLMKWLKDAGLRAVKTIGQVGLSRIAGAATIAAVNWPQCGLAALLAGIVSLLTSVVSLPEFSGKWAKTYWGALLMRIIRTAAQAAIGTIGSAALFTDVNWAIVASTVGYSVIACVFSNLANLPEVGTDKLPQPEEV